MNNGERGRTFSPRWTAWPKSIRREAGISYAMNPNWKQIVRKHLAALRLPPEREIEVVEELALHMEAVYEGALADGLSESEAEARAAQGYDWRLLECELSRAERPAPARALQPSLELIERKGGTRMESLLQDLRFGLRMLWKNPGFTLIAVFILSLGIGANTALFSIVNAVLLRSLPYPQSERLVALWQGPQRGALGQLPVSPPELMDYRAEQRVFEQLAAHTMADVSLSGSGEPERLRAAVVSADWFAALGSPPLSGRVFLPEEHQPGQNNTVVLSYGLWQRRFGGDAQILGRSVTLNGRARAVTGVMPPGFRFPAEADLWLPLAFTPEQLSPAQRPRHYLTAIARLKAGVTLAQAQEDVRAIAGRFPGGLNARLVGLREDLVGQAKAPLSVLMAAVVFVLLIACANVGGLLLARATARQGEMAIRQSLGASRGRLIRQSLTESLSLAFIGGVFGALLAAWSKELLGPLVAQALPRADEIRLDGYALAFALGFTLLTGLLFGLAPAWQAARLNLNETLKLGAPGAVGFSRRRARSLLVVSEVALAVLLLAGSGLFLRSFYHLTTASPGFVPAQVLTADLALPFARYDTNAKRAAFYQELTPRLAALPGAQAVGIVSDLPLSGMNADRSYTHDGVPPDQQRRSPPNADYRHCSPQYFNAIGIPLLRGRAFNEQDGSGGQPVVIVNETLARRIWPNEDAVGKRIAFFAPQGLEPWRVIVGVVGDVKHRGLNLETRPEVYVPHAQAPEGTMTLVLRAAGDPLALVPALRGAVRALDADLPLFNLRRFEQLRDDSIAPQRLQTLLLGLFAVVALALAALGIYGMLAYSVSQRAREIGVRMALGAQARDVSRLVVIQGMRLASLGVALGLLAAFALTRLLETLLFGVSPTDPLTFGAVTLLLIGVALVACWIPARRATKVDPLVALRAE
jgi:putative ABC transport system permease protein